MKGDMTSGNPAKKLFVFAIPMVLGNLFQQMYSIVDSMIVGKYVSADALAAVGTSTTITNLFISIAVGLSIGASVVISQLYGAGRYGKMFTAIRTIIITVLGISIVLMLIGLLLSAKILQLMNTPSNIFSDANTFLKVYFLGIVALFMFNTFNAVFNALGLSRIPLLFLFISSLINIVLDFIFVLQFHMGVAGVAYATLIAQTTSAIASFCVFFKCIRNIKLEESAEWFQKEILMKINKVAIPSIIQQSIVSIGYILVQSMVNQYGSTIVAGYTTAIKIDSIAIMPMVNVGSAISTFTAQNIGAQKLERVGKGLRAALFMVCLIGFSITVLLFIFGENFIAAFFEDDVNKKVIAVGVEYLRVVSIFYVIMGVMNNFNGVLRGAGDMKIFMVVTLCNLSTRVILAYSLTTFTNIGEKAIWWSIPIGWMVGLLIAASRYCSGKWKDKCLVIR